MASEALGRSRQVRPVGLWGLRRVVGDAVCAVQVHLPPQVSRLLFVRNLPFKITAKELYEVFGKYGAIRQVRIGRDNDPKTRGTAFVVMEDIFDAKSAVDHLSGFSVGGRYLTVLYYQPKQRKTSINVEAERAEIAALKERHGLSDGDETGDATSLAHHRGRSSAASGSAAMGETVRTGYARTT
jgi:pre-mRNA branch site protein p14